MILNTVKKARTWYPGENKYVNPELENKVSGKMDDSMLMNIIIKTHGKILDFEKETLKKLINDLKDTGSIKRYPGSPNLIKLIERQPHQTS